MRGILSDWISDPCIRQHIRTRGFSIARGVVDCPSDLVSCIRDEYLECTGEHPDHPMIQSHGVGQWPSMWNARSSTIKLWERMYGTNKLLSSWDGLSFVSPDHQNSLSDPNEHGEVDWMHIDQNPNNSSLVDTIQGVLCLTDAAEETYSTILYTPNRNYETAQDWIDDFHESRFVRTTRSGRKARFSYNDCDENHYVLSVDDLQWLREHGTLEKPVMNAGDVLLFASAMPHAAGRMRSQPSSSWRVSTYVSMAPKDIASPICLHERKTLAAKGLTSSHNIFNPRLFSFGYDALSASERDRFSKKVRDHRATRDIKNLIA